MTGRFIVLHVPCFASQAERAWRSGSGRKAALEDMARMGLSYTPEVRVDPAGEMALSFCGMERWYGGRFAGLPRALQAELKRRLGFRRVSVGAGPTDFIARLCARAASPDGVAVCEKGEELRTLSPLPVSVLPGLGRREMEALSRYNVRRLGDIQRLSAWFFERRLGQAGKKIYWMAQGLDLSDAGAPEPGAEPSLRAERAFPRDTNDLAAIRDALRLLADRIAFLLRERKLLARGLSLLIIYSDGKARRGGARLACPASDFEAVFTASRELLHGLYSRRVSLRRLCLRVQGLTADAGQTALFFSAEQEKKRRMGETLDAIRGRMGFSAVVNANLMEAAREGA